MPPMLNISFQEADGRRTVLAHDDVDEAHDILQLIAETEAPTGTLRFAPTGGTPGSGTAASR